MCAMDYSMLQSPKVEMGQYNTTIINTILPRAVSILGTCGTSVPSERLFFKAGEVVATRRSSIKPKNVDMTLFLNENLLCFGTVQ